MVRPWDAVQGLNTGDCVGSVYSNLQRTQLFVQVGLSVSSSSELRSMYHLSHESIKNFYFKMCSVCSNRSLLSDSFYLLCHTYSSCFSFIILILITAQLGKTQQAIVLAARHHDDGGSVPLSWPSVNSATVPQNTFILRVA